VHTYFCAAEVKKSLAEPVDFFHYKGEENWHRAASGEER